MVYLIRIGLNTILPCLRLHSVKGTRENRFWDKSYVDDSCRAMRIESALQGGGEVLINPQGTSANSRAAGA
jgi:hypothetical protein